MAKRLEDLPLYSKVLEFWSAVAAILRESQVRRNRKLFEQIDSANDSIDANMKEGFEQPTDAAFASFVVTAKGSLEEVVTRIRQAQRKSLVTDADLTRIEALGEPLAKMMGGFIKYLRSSGFTDRGRHAVAPSRPKTALIRDDSGSRIRFGSRDERFGIRDAGFEDQG
jgi:four helix bundle protein